MSAGKPVQVQLQDDELRALDNYRREQINPPSRADALRQLARAGGLGCRNGAPNSDYGADQLRVGGAGWQIGVGLQPDPGLG